MFREIATLHTKDSDYPDRAFDLRVLRAVLDGTFYDVLPFPFHVEKSPAQEYVPLRNRRPSVRYNLSRVVVEDSVSLLFGDGRFPIIECDDPDARNTFARLVKDSSLCAVMNEAATIGSVGSAVVFLRVLAGRVFFEAQSTEYLTPEWSRSAPDRLERLTERYKVVGAALRNQGYQIDDGDLGADFWFMRQWDRTSETWFVPAPVSSPPDTAAVDEARTVRHALGFVPAVWIKNLPGGNGVDGGCTFRQAIETQIEIDYQLSQAGRGLKYSSDPTLLIKEPAAADDGEIIRSAGNALVVSEKGDAKLLEISGTASDAVLGYAKFLRDLALESIHGNRSTADRLAVAQSGKAMELMHQTLIWLADRLRISYGDHGLLSLLRMVVAVRQKVALSFEDGPMDAIPAATRLSLHWPHWFHLTERDKLEQAQAVAAARAAGVLSQETAVKSVSPSYGAHDAKAELSRIASDEARADARIAAQAANTTATEAVPE